MLYDINAREIKNTMLSFAERLKKCMRLRGMSALQLSLITHISRSSICLYLQGARNPKTSQIYKLAQALSVAPSYLLGLTDQMFVPDIKPTISLYHNEEDEMRKALLDELLSICSYEETDNLKTILNVVKTLARKGK